jgi:hypothetical protein
MKSTKAFTVYSTNPKMGEAYPSVGKGYASGGKVPEEDKIDTSMGIDAQKESSAPTEPDDPTKRRSMFKKEI